MTPKEVIEKLAKGEYGCTLPKRKLTGRPRHNRPIPIGTDPVSAYFLGYTLREIQEQLDIDHNTLYILLGERRRRK